MDVQVDGCADAALDVDGGLQEAEIAFLAEVSLRSHPLLVNDKAAEELGEQQGGVDLGVMCLVDFSGSRWAA